MRQIFFTSNPGMIRVGVCNYCFVNRLPGIDINACLLAINTLICKLDEHYIIYGLNGSPSYKFYKKCAWKGLSLDFLQLFPEFSASPGMRNYNSSAHDISNRKHFVNFFGTAFLFVAL